MGVGAELGAGAGLRSKDPPRTRPPVLPLLLEGLEELLPEEDLEELEDERLLLEEDLEELEDERLEEPPPRLLASALETFNHSLISGVVGSIVTCAKHRKAAAKMNQR